MAKYGNKKCIKFSEDTSVGFQPDGYGIYAETPLSFSAGVFGDGGGASSHEFSYSFWIKADYLGDSSNQGLIYQIARAAATPRDHSSITLSQNPSFPQSRQISINVRNNSVDDLLTATWAGTENSVLNTRDEWLHCVITFDGNLSTTSGMTAYLNSVSSSWYSYNPTTVGDNFPPTVDGEGDPTSVFNATYNFQGLGMKRQAVTSPFQSENHLDAKIANFAIWNKKLSQDEINEIYNGGRLVDLKATTMESNLVQWNKCGNYHEDTNPASISATTTTTNNVANNASAPAPSGSFNRILGRGYGPTYKPQIVEDPVSTDMIFMDGFDQNTSATFANSITALNLRGWQNTIALDSTLSLILPGGQKSSANTAHWPKLDYSNSYVTSNKSKHLKLWPGNSAATAHGSPASEMNEIYNTFDPVTSGTVNLGFAIRIPRNAGNTVAGDLESTVCGFYWGDSNQPNPSSSLETGRLSVQFMGGTYSYLGWKPQLRRALAGDDAGTFTTVAEGPEGTFTTGGQDFLQSPLNNPIPGTDRYWYWVEAEIYPAETGTFKLFVNNSTTPAINYTGDTRGVNNTEVIDFMGFRFRQTSGAGPIVIDDVVAFHNKKATEQYCVALVPDAENFTGSFATGSSTGVTPAANCLESVNRALFDASDGDGVIATTGTFMVTTTDPDSASFSYDNLPFTPRYIEGVQAHNLINADGVTFDSIQNNLITGSTGLVTGSYLTQPNPGSWELVSELYSWHPTSSVNTSEEFSSADLDAIINEIKVK